MTPKPLPLLAGLASSAATLAAVSSVALAASGDAPRLADDPFLGRISGGAMVEYELTKKPGTQSVTIDGRTAKVKVIDAGEHKYRALVHRGGFKAGRHYRVVISSGGKRIASKALFLHRSMNR